MCMVHRLTTLFLPYPPSQEIRKNEEYLSLKIMNIVQFNNHVPNTVIGSGGAKLKK